MEFTDFIKLGKWEVLMPIMGTPGIPLYNGSSPALLRCRHLIFISPKKDMYKVMMLICMYSPRNFLPFSIVKTKVGNTVPRWNESE